MTDREAFEVWALSPAPDLWWGLSERERLFLAWQAATTEARERCAKVCIEWADAHAKDTGICTYENCDFVAAAMDCANAIRKGQR